MSAIPDTLHICETCGALAWGGHCPTCVEYAELVERCASRSGEFWNKLPRMYVDRPGVGPEVWRGALAGLVLSGIIAAVAALLAGFIFAIL